MISFGNVRGWMLAAVAAAGLVQGRDALFLEAEDVQFFGGWKRVADREASGRAYLQVSGVPQGKGAGYDALTLVSVDEPGEYAVWVRARDFATDRPKTRRFTVLVDGVPLAEPGGTHGQEGFAWQLLGQMTLVAGDHLVALRDTARAFGRCDALYLTRSGKSPAGLSARQLAAVRATPKRLAAEGIAAFRPVPVADLGGEPLATLETPDLRVAFAAGKDPGGRPWIVRRACVRVDGAWQALPDAAGGEVLFIQQSTNVTAELLRVALWAGARVPVEVAFNGKTYVTSGPDADPYSAAPARRLVPRELIAADAAGVELRYVTDEGLAVPVRWSLDPDDPFTLRAQARLTAGQAGSYSLGFSALQETARERVEFVQLPPLYQFQRLPSAPELLCNTLTPHPMALAQVPWLTNGAPLSVVVAAEPEDLPFVWPNATNAVCGFALLNSRAQVQPTFFSPVLGSPHARLAAGETRRVSWRVMTRPADWKPALEAVALNLMKVRDYREPVNASLTEAVLNMTDLMMDEEFGGWNAELKGFYDIESATMGKHAAPLALLSAAVISRSEAFWEARALPTFEFVLSRNGADIIQSGVNRDGQPVKGQIAVPSRFYGTTCWEGLHRLTGARNPWLKEVALPEGRFRHASAYNTSWPWTEMLAAHRLDAGCVSLDAVKADADAWLAKEVFGRKTEPVDFRYFYNIHFYPYWWDVVDLYEATGDERYLAAAVEGAFHTIAGQWSHPRVPEGQVTVHPDGSQVTYHRVWHKNDSLFRLGWPRQPNDTPAHEVPAWQVSPVGLGLEQPSTYTSYPGAMNNIMQSTWAPHLLRVYRHTHREIFRTFARNSVIGRFANYPGYYLTCFTDLVHGPRYPYAGPDITCFYYHHIPVHYAFAMDYLMADAEARSNGKVAFPWVKQKNYAWFNSRVYTAEPGRVFDDDQAVLWLERGLVATDDCKTDWLAARSPERFWVVLMNQTRAPKTVTARIDAAKAGLTAGGEGVLFEAADGVAAAQRRAAPALTGGAVSVTVPPLGLVALGYPASRREAFPASQPVPQGPRTADAGPFGKAHVFTLRSPWGKDAVYAVLTADARPGAKVTFTCGGVTRSCGRFPYEASFYPVTDAAATVKIVAESDGQTRELSL